MSIDYPAGEEKNGPLEFDYTKIWINENAGLTLAVNNDEEEVDKGAVTVYVADGDKNGQLVLNREVEDEDPWTVDDHPDTTAATWSELDSCGKVKHVIINCIGKIIALLLLLYIFICSLSFLSDSFRLLGGRTAGKVFSQNSLIQNPIAALMIGILATALVQSSSTSTSIVVTMCASGIIDVQPAIPIIMGANIGTSLTNTLVALAQSPNRNEFRRAFAGATVHDMFNWLSVLVLLPVEVACGYLYKVTSALVKILNITKSTGAKPKLLSVITDPFTKQVIQLNKQLIEDIALGRVSDADESSLIKDWCKTEKVVISVNKSLSSTGAVVSENVTAAAVSYNDSGAGLVNETVTRNVAKCSFLFHDTGLSDTVIGILLLVASLFAMCTALILLVKLLSSMLRGHIARTIKKTINSDLPGCLSYFTGYIAIIVGAILTILVQSSSIFTSTLTPLVGIGVITVERMYPLTLGSNIGTTGTGMLAAMANSEGKLHAALQIALCHLFFNITGILLFYPVPVMRLPVRLAKILGNTTARYRWFAALYLFIMFFILPAAMFGLSMAGIDVMLGIGLPILCIFLFIILVNVLQRKAPCVLPPALRTWEKFPEWMHSLDPLDRIITGVLIKLRCCRCCIAAALPVVPPTRTYHHVDREARVLLHASAAGGSQASSCATSAMPSRQPSRANLSHSPSQFTMDRENA